MMIRLLFTPFICYTNFIARKGRSYPTGNQKKNSAIIKQKKRKEKSILKELGTLRTNIYLTQKKLNQAYRKYNSYQQQIKRYRSQAFHRKTAPFANKKLFKRKDCHPLQRK